MPQLYVASEFLISPIGELRTGIGEPLHDAAVLVRDGQVAAVGPARDFGSGDLDASGLLVTAGLVDCHTHLVWGGDRSSEFLRRCNGESYQSIASAGGGILSTMRATRDCSVSELASGIVSRCELLLSLGTTTVEIKASYGLSPEASWKELEAIAIARKLTPIRIIATFMGAHAFPPEYSRDEYLSLLVDKMIPAASGRAEFCDVFCEVGAFDVTESRIVLEAGIANGLTPKIHADEFNALGGVQMACELGAASCDHLLVSGDGEIATLADSSTVAVVMPSTAFYLDKPYANARKMLDTGCTVALGSDFNPGSSQVPSMAFAMGLGVSKMQMSPIETLMGATHHSSRALRRDGGRIEVGKDADLCIWPAKNLDHLVYQFAFIRPNHVMLGGEIVV